MTNNTNHQTNLPSDDPNLTAYALGELEPGSDVYEQVKARLEVDADAKAFVEQTRSLAHQLDASYSNDAVASTGLSDHQQKELAAMIEQQDNKATEPITPPKSFWLSRPALLAAGLALAAGAAITTITLVNQPDEPTSGQIDSIAVTGLDKVGENFAGNVAVDFENAPLSEVFAFLNKQTNVAIETDWDALAKRGVTAQTPVTLKTDELVPAGRVLTAALEAAWSRSPHPDPAQWTMTDAGVSIAPQSTLVQARLDAASKLLESDRLSRSVIDTRMLSADTAEVWESDLWNRVLAQRDQAAKAVLAEADMAFTTAEDATKEEDFDRAARQTMYAYNLLVANNSLLAPDQFTEPNERFVKLNKAIATHQQKEDEAAWAEAIDGAKAELATLDEETIKTRAATATEKVQQGERAQSNGNLHAAAQLYGEATLLNPLNGEYQKKFKDSKAKLSEQRGTNAKFYNALGDNDLDRAKLLRESSFDAIRSERSDRIRLLSRDAALTVPAATSAKRGAITPTSSYVAGRSLAAGYAGKANNQIYFQKGIQNYGSAGLKRQEAQQGQQWFDQSDNAIGLVGVNASAGVALEAKKKRIEKSAGKYDFQQSRATISRLTDEASDAFGGEIIDSRYANDSYLATPVVQPQEGEDGKTISRRVHLEKRLEKLVDEKPLPQLDEQTQAHYRTITIALEDAKVLEEFELKRLAEIKDLEELHGEFQRGCIGVFEIDPEMSRDAFAVVNDNPFYDPAEPGRTLSTFSVDVDTAAYTIARRQLMERNHLPTPGAVRIEEMINYFDYNYKAPVVDRGALEDGVVTQASLEAYEKKHDGFAPFATHIQVTDCPWTAGNQLVRIGIKGMEVAQEDRPSAHLTFLLDVSGSMRSPNKLGLVKDSLKLLLDKLNDQDHVSIVVYAGASGLVLENVPATEKLKIEQALDKLRAGGSTAGAAGIQLAYETAQKHYIDGGVNRVILCTDGDFNVGISGTDALVDLIKSKANPEADADGKRRGVYLSVMGYGMGNLNDAMMEPLTNAGNGNYAYIDTLREATKVMYDQVGASLVTIAKDVKIQVQFDPDQVMAYRLIGYENRVLANEDFDNDKVDAGDIGAGHSVTALYEIVPFAGGDGLDGGGIYEVRHRLDELENAVALNQSLMQTAALNPKHSMKLAASTRMLEQEIMLTGAVLEKMENDKPANADEGGEAEPVQVAPLDDGAILAVKLRYKPVDAPAEDGTSRLIETSVFADEMMPFEVSDESTRFAAAVASFAMQLRSSPHAGDVDLDWVHDTAQGASGHDPGQFKAELLDLIKKANGLMPKKIIEEEVDRGL